MQRHIEVFALTPSKSLEHSEGLTWKRNRSSYFRDLATPKFHNSCGRVDSRR